MKNGKRICFIFMLLIICFIFALLIFLSGCTMAPSKTELFNGVAEPRDDYDLTVKYVPFFATDWACRKQIRETNSKPALPPILFWYSACATIPPDAALAKGERPWCKVILRNGVTPGDSLYEHEIAHCEGWSH